MSKEVVRQDVVQVAFDVDDSPLLKAQKDLDELKKSVTGVGKEDGLDKMKEQADRTKSSMGGLGDETKKFGSSAQSTFSRVRSSVQSMRGDIDSAANAIQSKVFNIKNLIAGIATGAVVSKSIDVVVDRQNITSQFEVLLGSAKKARKRVEELTDFAGMTPFTRDEIFAASKQLQVFTGDALSTGNSLKVIGDVASGTGQSFEDVALWCGRLYDAMKSNRKVGEMTSRLQEMGAISGEDRTKIEKLAAAGGDITKRWGEVEKIFSRYDGTMEKLSNNLGNMLTSLKSFATNSIFLPIGQGITKGLQPAIQKFRQFRKDNKKDIDGMGEVFNKFVAKICVPLFNKIETGVEGVIKAIGALKGGVNGLNKFKGKSPILDFIVNGLQFIISHKKEGIDALQGIAIAAGGIVAVSKFDKILSTLKFLRSPLGIVCALFFTWFMNFKKNGGTVEDLLGKVKGLLDNLKKPLSFIKDITEKIGNGSLFEKLGAAAPIIIGLIAAFKGFKKLKSVFGFFKGFGESSGKSSSGFIGGIAGFFESLGKLKMTTVLKGLANLAIISVGMSLITGVVAIIAAFVSQVTDFQTVIKMVALLGTLGTVGFILTEFAGIVGAIPITIVLKGLAAMALVVGGLSLLLVAFGALSQIEGFDDFISKGGDTLANVFKQIGKIGGAIVGGFGEGVSGSLPVIADNISKFAKNLQPMFEIFGSADIKGISGFFLSFGAFLFELTGQKYLSIFTGEIDFASMGSQLGKFAYNSKSFFDAVSQLPKEGFKKARSLFEVFAGLNKLPHSGGVVQWFMGEVDYDKVSNGLGKLSNNNVSGFFASVNKIKKKTFAKVKTFFEALSGIGSLPNSGGVVQWFCGEVDYTKISAGLGKLSNKNAKGFFNTVGKFKNSAFKSVKNFFEALSGIGSLPNSGGVAQWFAGDVDYDKISNGLGKLSNNNVSGFVNTIANTKKGTLDKIKVFFSSLSEIGSLPNSGGVAQWFGGEVDYSKISNGIKQLSNANVKSLLNILAEVKTGTLDKMKVFFEALSHIGSLPNSGGVGSWFSGEVDYDKISKGVGKLANENITNFTTFIDGVEKSALDKMKTFFEALSHIGGLPNSDGLMQWFTGEVDYNKVASGVGQLGNSKVTGFLNVVTKIKQETFSKMKTFFEALSNIGSLPNSNGLAQWFAGDVDYSKVANGLLTLSGSQVTGFLSTISVYEQDTFDKMVAFFTSLSEIGNLPKSGGIGSWFSGDIDYGKIASGLALMASSQVISFYKALQKTTTTTFKDIVNRTFKLTINMSTALLKGRSALNLSMVSVLNSMKNKISDNFLYDKGKNVMSGFNNGLKAVKGQIETTAKNIAKTVSKTIDKTLDIHSPSKVTEKSGFFAGMGPVKGLLKAKPLIEATSEDIGQTMSSGIGSYDSFQERTVTKSNVSKTEYNNYSPQFNLTIEGGNDKDLKNKVKGWVKEAFSEAISSVGRSNPKLQEV